MALWCALFVLSISIVVSRLAAETDVEISSLCRVAPSAVSEKDKCNACIRSHPNCAWCADVAYGDERTVFRCDVTGNMGQCQKIVNPRSEIIAIKNQTLSPLGVNEKVIQMQPQSLRIRLRPNDTQTVMIKFVQAADYPVDLYYLMDLSCSMSDDKEKLSQLGTLLSQRMKEITKNFRLGFGTFSDKAVVPFIHPIESEANEPCITDYATTKPYDYKHVMNLSSNAYTFERRVREAAVSRSLDTPEGGFDGLGQALACGETIGWRNKSRKIIVYSTDAGYKIAGDGKIASIITPFDGMCHLNEKNAYDKGDQMDYPSIGRIYKMLRDVEANLIFAVTHEHVPLYTRLKQTLTDISATVGTLESDSKNIVDLIITHYLELSQKIQLVHSLQEDRDGIRLDFAAKCGEKGVMEDGKTCKHVLRGDEMTFFVNVTVVHCETKNRTFNFAINPAGLSDSVTITLEKICDCDCAVSAKQPLPPSHHCSNRGKLVCGVCVCPPGWVGHNCECDVSKRPEIKTTKDLELHCRLDQDPDNPICNGQPDCACKCGKCVRKAVANTTDKYHFGDYCQFFTCPRCGVNNTVCGGNGQCVDGNCKCKPGFIEPDCCCERSPDKCRTPDGKICRDRGVCECGRCLCHDEYSGDTCEECPTCPHPCERYKPCVFYKMRQRGPYNETDYNEKCLLRYNISVNETLPDIWENKTLSETCAFTDDEGCTIYYKYHPVKGDPTVLIIWEHRDCPTAPPTLAIILGVIAGIVIIGLVLLLLWKLLTLIHDRREYAKFEQERLQSKWDTGENPIFHPATTTFPNPVYAGK